MKNTAPNKENSEQDVMCPEYSFKAGERGKHAKAYHKGHKVEVRQEDGANIVRRYRLEDGAVMLAPDVRKYFPDSKFVNKALQGLIQIAPKKRRSTPRAT